MRTSRINFIRPEYGFYHGPEDGKGGGAPAGGAPAGGAPAGGAPAEGAEPEPTTGTITEAALQERLARQQRQFEAQRQGDRAQWEQDLAAFHKAENATAEETANAARDAALGTATAAERKALATSVESAALRLALTAGVNPKRSAKFLRLLTLDPAKVAPGGAIDEDEIAALIADELKDSPEFAGEGTPAPKAPEGSPADHSGGGGGAEKIWTRAQVDALSIEEFDKHEEVIMDQMRRGLVK
ncbi:hypothetical protein UFOVP1360_47 [uncultured Caudovirales phage]|uniref:Scaffolding protein n=1 Tax=uncultured Caudovirales phage TaxID=2100421 RepID=A0A6J5RUD2_9CAUD|nr:hypothetical protein UFOVP1360_47 [uncultured Caudovirales phage]